MGKMLPNSDLERLITEKRHEIEREKILLGLSPAALEHRQEESVLTTSSNNDSPAKWKGKTVTIAEDTPRNDRPDDVDQTDEAPEISAELERYIRRYLGLPVMLKAGEYSPNNPLVRAERTGPADVLLSLGEYERRRNTLRKIRQQQYREYLDEQARKKQEAKEQAERERREREEKERLREEEKEREREQARQHEEERRASVCYVGVASKPTVSSKVDTAVQVGSGHPLSVAVQTEHDLYEVSPSKQHTQAERELSPRTVGDSPMRRRRSYGPTEEELTYITHPRQRLVSDLRHSYKPSIFDADAIHMRNLQAQKEAAERRQFYQQELKSQILEQQRIREERKTREKMLEQAEMRRLEEQLRMLRLAQEKETDRHKDIALAAKEYSTEYENKRKSLQREIDLEQKSLFRVTRGQRINTSQSDTNLKLPTFHTRREKLPFSTEKLPYSTNIPANSIFNPNYDVDAYLRKNLNPKPSNFKLNFDIPTTKCDNIETNENNNNKENIVIEKAIIHDRPKEKPRIEKSKYEPRYQNPHEIIDETPIPVLRHSPKIIERKDSELLSPEMKQIDDKWKVPVVQKNILKTLPNEEGKNVSILTQLGSIRRQLQLEQLRLDSLSKN